MDERSEAIRDTGTAAAKRRVHQRLGLSDLRAR
jgi:hypothetical protein